MFSKEFEKLFFKVKKVKIYGAYEQGIVYPIFKNTYMEGTRFDTNNYNFLSLQSGKVYCLNNKHKFERTKVSNDIKQEVDMIIKSIKENYNKEKKLVKLKKEFDSIINELNSENEKVEEQMEGIITKQGYISKNSFSETIESCTIKTKYHDIEENVEPIYSENKIIGIRLEQVKKCEKYANENSYDFLYEEYDGELMVSDYLLEKSNDLNKIINKNMLLLNSNFKLKDCVIKESKNAFVGDKRTVYVSYDITIKFNKAKELTKESLNYILSLIKKFQ